MSAHLKAQLLRFLRTSGASFAVLYFAQGGRLDWASLWAVGPGVLETLLRQARPVQPLPAAGARPAPPGAAP